MCGLMYSVIEAQVLEISPTEIRYRRSDHLDGPVIVIPAANVLSIRYENGRVDVITAVPPDDETVHIEAQSGRTTFGINADPSGFLMHGPTVAAELTVNRFITMFDVRFSSAGLMSTFDGFGIGLGLGFGYYHPTRIGGFYALGFGEFSTSKYEHTDWQFGGIAALNAGYRFMLPSGMYFRTGGFLGAAWFGGSDASFLIKPDLTFGYNFIGRNPAVMAAQAQPASRQPVQQDEEQRDDARSTPAFSVKFSFGFIFPSIFSTQSDSYYWAQPGGPNTDGYFEHYYSGSETIFNWFNPTFDLRFLWSFENNLRLGFGGNVHVSLFGISDYQYPTGGTGAAYGIIGYDKVHLHAGYDFALNALYLTPQFLLGKRFMLGVPMSLLGNNEYGIYSIYYIPKRKAGSRSSYSVARATQFGISFQWVVGGHGR